MTRDKKQTVLTTKLGQHMAESAGVRPIGEDRYLGFIPSDTNSGEMALDRIIEDDSQPRKHYDQDSLKQFAAHLKIHGVQTPIQLRWNDRHQKWQIVFGHRRYRASIEAGLKTIPCTFVDEKTDEPTIRIRQLVENCQRENLGAMEMARAIDALQKLTEWSNRRLGNELGMSHVSIGRYLELLVLPDEVQQKVDNGELALSTAIDLRKLQGKLQQKKIANEIVQQKLNRNQAKQLVEQTLDSSLETPSSSPNKSKKKEVLLQNINITIYRNPDASDILIQKELLAAAAQIDSEKSET